MYLTISNFKNGETIEFLRAIDNRAGNLKVALCEFLYYPQWFNISAELENNKFRVNGNDHTIPDGYYNVCNLNDYFKEYNCKLTINEATGKLKIEVVGGREKNIFINSSLAETLGFLPDTTFTGSKEAEFLPNLINHKEIFVHLDCINTSENIFREKGSTVLRSIPVGNEELNSGKHERFPELQYKELNHGDIYNMKISILDSQNNPLDMGYTSLVLHVE